MNVEDHIFIPHKRISRTQYTWRHLSALCVLGALLSGLVWLVLK